MVVPRARPIRIGIQCDERASPASLIFFIFRFHRSAAPPSISRLARLTTLYRLAEATRHYPLVDGQQQRLGNHAFKIIRFSFLAQRHDVA